MKKTIFTALAALVALSATPSFAAVLGLRMPLTDRMTEIKQAGDYAVRANAGARIDDAEMLVENYRLREDAAPGPDTMKQRVRELIESAAWGQVEEISQAADVNRFNPTAMIPILNDGTGRLGRAINVVIDNNLAGAPARFISYKYRYMDGNKTVVEHGMVIFSPQKNFAFKIAAIKLDRR